MLLTIDVGNTQTVLGLYGDADEMADSAEASPSRRDRGSGPCEDGLIGHWRASTVADRTADEQALIVQEFLGFRGVGFDDDVHGVAISSVVPRCTAALREMTERYLGFSAVVIEPGVRTGLPILTENPREVGADRIANAVAAIDVFGGPALVIDFGTATTYDAISAKGELLGVAIAPGIDISLDALYQRADALRRVEVVEPRSVIGRNTVEAIQAGVVYGFAGQVEGICRRMLHELGDATVVATGGLAELIVPYTGCVAMLEPWLTLHGLRLIFERNCPDGAGR